MWDDVDTHPEEGDRAAALQRPVLDFRLLRQIFGALDGRVHALDSQKCSEVGSVRWDHNQREEPPHPSHDSASEISSLIGAKLCHRNSPCWHSSEWGGNEKKLILLFCNVNNFLKVMLTISLEDDGDSRNNALHEIYSTQPWQRFTLKKPFLSAKSCIFMNVAHYTHIRLFDNR